MRTEQLRCLMALNLIPNIGTIRAKQLVQHFGNPEEIFSATKKELLDINSITPTTVEAIFNFKDWKTIDEEFKFLEDNNIEVVSIYEKEYPQRMVDYVDAPVLLFKKGATNLNQSKIISIVGTRKNTEYGKQLTEALVGALVAQNILVVSGMAFGIDAVAHKQTVKQKGATIGVVAHGLDTLYPPEHKPLAKDMLALDGCLLSECMSGTKADRFNFPKRNRIVAGICDALVVIETDIKGGSMITANIAHSYNKDVFAFPGKTSDKYSSGCNYLIANHIAQMLIEPEDLLKALNWQPKKTISKKIQRELFVNLEPIEQQVLDKIPDEATIHIDLLTIQSNLTSGEIANALLMLELKGIIASLPGKRYQKI
jgi:DNA processing protein